MSGGSSDAARSALLLAEDVGRVAAGKNKEKYDVVRAANILADGVPRQVFLLCRRDNPGYFDLYDERGRWFDSFGGGDAQDCIASFMDDRSETLWQLKSLHKNGDRNPYYNLLGVARRPAQEAGASPFYW